MGVAGEPVGTCDLGPAQIFGLESPILLSPNRVLQNNPTGPPYNPTLLIHQHCCYNVMS